MRLLKGFEPHAYALLRIAAGLLFLFHGLQKLFGMYGGRAVEVLSLRGLAGIIELAGGSLVMVGLYASPAAFLASGTMAFAYFLSHQPQAFWPIQNRGELAALYCFVFLYIATRGSGMWSIDWLRGRRR
jgi:putative oxidoreductase